MKNHPCFLLPHMTGKKQGYIIRQSFQYIY